MKFDDEIGLAWDLLDALPAVTGTQRMALCVEIGAGELPSAIEHLLAVFISLGRVLSPDLTPRVSMWLNSYDNYANHAALHQLLHDSAARTDPS